MVVLEGGGLPVKGRTSSSAEALQNTFRECPLAVRAFWDPLIVISAIGIYRRKSVLTGEQSAADFSSQPFGTSHRTGVGVTVSLTSAYPTRTVF